MKIIKTMSLAIMIMAAFSHCSSPVYVQRDESANLAKFKTYMWIETKANENDTRNTTAFAEQTMHQRVNAELSRRGWREVNNNPDVLIGHDILVERNVQRQSDPVYSQPFSRVYYNPWARRWGTIYYPSQFIGYDTYDTPVREGTITITMMDANSDKTIWQAWTTEQMNNRRITDAEIAKAVKHIFKKLDTNR